MTAEEQLRVNRRREAELLVCRLISDRNRLCRDLAEIAEGSRDAQRMQRDPGYVADNLGAVAPELMHYDLVRLLDLIREGF